MKQKILFGYNFDKTGFKSLERDFELIYPENQFFTKEELKKLLPEADVLVPNFGYKTDADVIACGTQLQLIANFGVGYDNIDVNFATSKGITVTNTPNSVLEPTAELSFALILAASRRLCFYNTSLRTEAGLKWGLYNDLGITLSGKTLGIFGMGRIGQAVARRAISFGMNIIYNNRSRLDEKIEAEYNARYVSFETLLDLSDVISINAPATDETYHIFNKNSFSKMKSNSVLVNVARGSLVDEKDLAWALNNGTIGAAGIDVFENEPHILPDLLSLNNIVLTPHAGTKTIGSRLEMQGEVSKNIQGFFNGGEISKVN